MSKEAAATSAPDPNVFPNSSVCLIDDVIPGAGAFRGSGVIIGPHTILTASHVLWDAGAGAGASSATVTAGLDSTVIRGAKAFHYNEVDDRGDELDRVGSSKDFAIIDTARDLSRFGSFDLSPGFGGGDVSLSGYPANRQRTQIETQGSVTTGPAGQVLNYAGFTLAPGYSGGPAWVGDGAGGAGVVGVVSTTLWACRLTAADVRQINRWEAQDAGLWTDTAATASLGATASPHAASQAHASAAALISGTSPVWDGGAAALGQAPLSVHDAGLVSSLGGSSDGLAPLHDPHWTYPLVRHG